MEFALLAENLGKGLPPIQDMVSMPTLAGTSGKGHDTVGVMSPIGLSRRR